MADDQTGGARPPLEPTSQAIFAVVALLTELILELKVSGAIGDRFLQRIEQVAAAIGRGGSGADVRRPAPAGEELLRSLVEVIRNGNG